MFYCNMSLSNSIKVRAAIWVPKSDRRGVNNISVPGLFIDDLIPCRIDLRCADHLYLRINAVVGAEIHYFLCLRNPTDQRSIEIHPAEEEFGIINQEFAAYRLSHLGKAAVRFHTGCV